MAVTVPTPDDVQQLFSQAITQATGATQPLDRQVFSRHLRSVLNPAWEQPAPGVERLPVGQGVSLFRGQLRVIIDNHQAGQQQAIQGQINSLAAQLAGLVPSGATVGLLFEFPPPRSVPFGQEVDCMVQGIVQSVQR